MDDCVFEQQIEMFSNMNQQVISALIHTAAKLFIEALDSYFTQSWTFTAARTEISSLLVSALRHLHNYLSLFEESLPKPRSNSFLKTTATLRDIHLGIAKEIDVEWLNHLRKLRFTKAGIDRMRMDVEEGVVPVLICDAVAETSILSA